MNTAFLVALKQVQTATHDLFRNFASRDHTNLMTADEIAALQHLADFSNDVLELDIAKLDYEAGRMKKIGEIRTWLPRLWEDGRFELAKEIMGGIHQDNFSGVSHDEVDRIHCELARALTCHPAH